jgi:hypothetical protein
MSISLSGGDIAFIAAFIVLPTFILASCIWALIAIRAGVLLPERARLAPADDADAMSPEWPYVEQAAAEAEPAAPYAEPAAPYAATDERTAELSTAQAQPKIEPEPSVAAESSAPTVLATEELAVVRDPTQETGEYIINERDWSRPNGQPPQAAAPAEPPPPVAPETQRPGSDADDGEVETWDTEPEPEPTVDNDTGGEAADAEHADHTTDLPPSAAVKRKPRRAAVAQLRPPVATTGRSRLRPSSARRPGEADELATVDEDAMQRDDRGVDVGGADDE